MDPYIGSKIVRTRQEEMRAVAERERLAREHLLGRRIARSAAVSLSGAAAVTRRAMRLTRLLIVGPEPR